MADKQTVKVGDKVRCLVTEFDVRKGELYEVLEVQVNGRVWFLDDLSDRFYLEVDEYELLPVAEATGKPALTIETGKFYRTCDGRKVGPMDTWIYGGWHTDRAERPLNGGLWTDNGTAKYPGAKDSPDLIAEWVDEPASIDNAPLTKPAIVALIENDQPKPSEQPKVHKSEQAATDEAERLAVKYPGQKFGVFVLADSRIADVVIRRAA